MEKSLEKTHGMTSGYFRIPKLLSGEAFSWLNHTEDPRHILDPLLRQLIQESAPTEKVALRSVSQSLKRLGAACHARYAAILRGESSEKVWLTLIPVFYQDHGVVEQTVEIEDLGPIKGVFETAQSRI